jgi:hypothetical protein
MNWREVAGNWPAFVEAAAVRWPQADATRLLAIDGNREQFEAYISETHDLTQAEVREDVEVLLAGALLPRTETSGSAHGRRNVPAEEPTALEDGDLAGSDRVHPAGRLRDG